MDYRKEFPIFQNIEKKERVNISWYKKKRLEKGRDEKKLRMRKIQKKKLLKNHLKDNDCQ